MRKIEVIPYDQRWTSMFEKEDVILREIFGFEIIEVHHIGSTSVPGLHAKPIIDIMTEVRDINRVDEFNKSMVAIGYVPKGEFGIVGRRYFSKGGDFRTHHVHIYKVGSPEIERHLAFRDYLRMHPSEAKKYGDLKEKLAKQFPYDLPSYVNGKESFLLEINRKAMDWWRKLDNGFRC